MSMKEFVAKLRACGISDGIIERYTIPLLRNGERGRVWHRHTCRKRRQFTNLIEHRTFTLEELDGIKTCGDCCPSYREVSPLRTAVGLYDAVNDAELTATGVAQVRERLASFYSDDDELVGWVADLNHKLKRTWDTQWILPTFALRAAAGETTDDGASRTMGDDVELWVPGSLLDLIGGNVRILRHWYEELERSARSGAIAAVDLDELDLTPDALDVAAFAGYDNWQHCDRAWPDPLSWLAAEWVTAIRGELAALQDRLIASANTRLGCRWTLGIRRRFHRGMSLETERAIDELADTVGSCVLNGDRYLLVPENLATAAWLRTSDDVGPWTLEPGEAHLLETIAELSESMGVSEAIAVARIVRA